MKVLIVLVAVGLLSVFTRGESLRHAAANKLASAWTGEIWVNFPAETSVTIGDNKGTSTACKVSGTQLYVSSHNNDPCPYSVTFPGRQPCKDLSITISGGAWSAYIVNHVGDENCYKILSSSGDKAVGDSWPCQNDGCSGSPGVTMQVGPIDSPVTAKVTASWQWEPCSNAKMLLKSETSSSKGSSSTTTSTSTQSATISAGYGPVSAEGSVSQELVQEANTQLNQANSQGSEIQYLQCPANAHGTGLQGRWRFVWVLSNGVTLNTNQAICTEANIKPKCPSSKCNTSVNCQTCHE